MEPVFITAEFVVFTIIKACFYRLFIIKNLNIGCQASENI